MLAWRVSHNDPQIASFRYRALLPLSELAKRGVKSRIYAAADEVDFFERPEALILVKAFNDFDVQQAQLAHELGIPVILDLCDNIFYTASSSKRGRTESADNFKKLAQFAHAIVVTGPSLVEVVREQVGNKVPIVEIPDCVETEAELRDAKALSRHQRIEFAFGHGFYWVLRTLPVRSFRIIGSRLTGLLKTTFVGEKPFLLRREYIFESLYFHFVDSVMRLFSPGIRRVADAENRLARRLLKERIEARDRFRFAATDLKAVSGQAGTVQPPAVRVEDTAFPEGNVVLWYGNGGTPGVFGITDLLPISNELVALSKRLDFTLVVVSDSYLKYRKYIEPLPLRTVFLPWNAEKITSQIQKSRVVIIPNPMNPFSLCKSANRATLALHLGVPVVATETPALKPFEGSIIFNDWSGIEKYIVSPELKSKHLAAAQKVIAEQFSLKTIGGKWATLLNEITAKSKTSEAWSVATQPITPA